MKHGAVASIISLSPGREASTEYEPPRPGKGNVQALYSTLSIVSLKEIYKYMLGTSRQILPRDLTNTGGGGGGRQSPKYKGVDRVSTDTVYSTRR